MRSLLDISVCVVMLCICIHGATSTATVSFNQSTYFTKHGNFTLTITLVRDETVPDTVSVLVKDSDDDSTFDNITFSIDQSEAHIDATLPVDKLPASFIIDSVVPSNVSVGEIDHTTVERIPKHVSFAKDKYKVNENNGSVFIQLTLDEKSSSDIAVKVNNLDTSKDDYSPGPYIITIHAGDTTALFNISICNDSILEGDESIILLIDSFYNDIVTGSDQYQTVVTIIDTTRVAASTFPKKLLMPNLVTILWEKVPGDSSWVSGTKVSSSRRWSSSAEVYMNEEILRTLLQQSES